MFGYEVSFGFIFFGGLVGRRFRLDIRLRRIRRKDWRRDFFRDFIRDSGFFKVSWSLGCSVYLGEILSF